MVNKQGISLREGAIYWDGTNVAGLQTGKIVFTPEVATYKVVGDKSDNSRWLGYKITVTISGLKSNDFIKNKIAEYKKSGRTPEMTIQGYRSDKNSDYYQATKKNEMVTAVGCVPTGDITLFDLDTNGEVVTDTFTFNAKDVNI